MAKRDDVIKAVRAMLSDLPDDERAAVVAAFVVPLNAREKIERALAATGGNITQAAVVLNCSRRTLFNQMRALKMPNGGKGGRRRTIGTIG